jgi:hypothetical protein
MRSLLGLWACWPVSRSLAIPDTLVLATVPADTARHVRGVGAVLEVISAGCRQGGLERGKPLFVGLDEGGDLDHQVADRGKDAAAQGLAFDDPEPDLGEVQPGP